MDEGYSQIHGNQHSRSSSARTKPHRSIQSVRPQSAIRNHLRREPSASKKIALNSSHQNGYSEDSRSHSNRTYVDNHHHGLDDFDYDWDREEKIRQNSYDTEHIPSDSDVEDNYAEVHKRGSSARLLTAGKMPTAVRLDRSNRSSRSSSAHSKKPSPASSTTNHTAAPSSYVQQFLQKKRYSQEKSTPAKSSKKSSTSSNLTTTNGMHGTKRATSAIHRKAQHHLGRATSGKLIRDVAKTPVLFSSSSESDSDDETDKGVVNGNGTETKPQINSSNGMYHKQPNGSTSQKSGLRPNNHGKRSNNSASSSLTSHADHNPDNETWVELQPQQSRYSSQQSLKSTPSQTQISAMFTDIHEDDVTRKQSDILPASLRDDRSNSSSSRPKQRRSSSTRAPSSARIKKNSRKFDPDAIPDPRDARHILKYDEEKGDVLTQELAKKVTAAMQQTLKHRQQYEKQRQEKRKRKNDLKRRAEISSDAAPRPTSAKRSPHSARKGHTAPKNLTLDVMNSDDSSSSESDLELPDHLQVDVSQAEPRVRDFILDSSQNAQSILKKMQASHKSKQTFHPSTTGNRFQGFGMNEDDSDDVEVADGWQEIPASVYTTGDGHIVVNDAAMEMDSETSESQHDDFDDGSQFQFEPSRRILTPADEVRESISLLHKLADTPEPDPVVDEDIQIIEEIRHSHDRFHAHHQQHQHHQHHQHQHHSHPDQHHQIQNGHHHVNSSSSTSIAWSRLDQRIQKRRQKQQAARQDIAQRLLEFLESVEEDEDYALVVADLLDSMAQNVEIPQFDIKRGKTDKPRSRNQGSRSPKSVPVRKERSKATKKRESRDEPTQMHHPHHEHHDESLDVHHEQQDADESQGHLFHIPVSDEKSLSNDPDELEKKRSKFLKARDRKRQLELEIAKLRREAEEQEREEKRRKAFERKKKKEQQQRFEKLRKDKAERGRSRTGTANGGRDGNSNSKSNKNIIKNALCSTACLGNGAINADKRTQALKNLAESSATHFVVVLRDPNNLKFRGFYGMNSEGQFKKLYGAGPKTLKPTHTALFFRFDSGSKEFKELPTKDISVCDAVALKPSCWPKPKVY